ncbi:MAG TPA: hypothetical protein VEI97_20665, partial [bacterium]|nr:hypothetical protein [bacterium]
MTPDELWEFGIEKPPVKEIARDADYYPHLRKALESPDLDLGKLHQIWTDHREQTEQVYKIPAPRDAFLKKVYPREGAVLNSLSIKRPKADTLYPPHPGHFVHFVDDKTGEPFLVGKVRRPEGNTGWGPAGLHQDDTHFHLGIDLKHSLKPEQISRNDRETLEKYGEDGDAMSLEQYRDERNVRLTPQFPHAGGEGADSLPGITPASHPPAAGKREGPPPKPAAPKSALQAHHEQLPPHQHTKLHEAMRWINKGFALPEDPKQASHFMAQFLGGHPADNWDELDHNHAKTMPHFGTMPGISPDYIHKAMPHALPRAALPDEQDPQHHLDRRLHGLLAELHGMDDGPVPISPKTAGEYAHIFNGQAPPG